MVNSGEYDVIVVGYGLAGAIAAIEAHDHGVRALIVEKGQHPGGLSILSGGAILCAQDAEDASNYLRATSGNRVDESLISPIAHGLRQNEQYLNRLCLVNNARTQREASRDPAGYPFPGRDTFYIVRVNEIPGFGGYPWVQRLAPAGVNLMKVAIDNVDRRDIDVLLSSPAKRLLTNAHGIVTGVLIEHDGIEITIKARRAVVLASGGFEQNQWLQMQYLQGKPFYSMAPQTHTGDGIIMAQKAGAALWHMWHVHGSYGFKFADFPFAFRHSIPGPRNPKRKMPWIVVDRVGYRYMNEYPPASQDTGHRPMEVFDPDMPGYSRIPSYLIFDEEGRNRGPIAHPLASGQLSYEWSKNNLKEIEKGWILADNTIEGLALKIGKTADNDGKMDPDVLKDTVFQWNNIVEKGHDPLNRPAATMMSLVSPPFFAAPVQPIISNTQGGPQHNARQQVIDSFGEPIPHLYAAGELGSFWSHLYHLAGNLGECLHSGRTAGINAAADEPVV